jgi:hypothetical protein
MLRQIWIEKEIARLHSPEGSPKEARCTVKESRVTVGTPHLCYVKQSKGGRRALSAVFRSEYAGLGRSSRLERFKESPIHTTILLGMKQQGFGRKPCQDEATF